jgi:hypothetical protein
VQKRVLAVIAAGRSPESYLAGGAVLNRERPRLSDDLDIFHDEEHRVLTQAERDVAALATAGFRLRPVVREFGLVEYEAEGEEGRTIVQWMGDTDLRFFPILQDEIFGWRLSDADLAVNKVMAAASRRQVRDAVDVAALHRDYLSLGALAWAAAGKTALGPGEIVENVVRNAVTQPREAYAAVRSTEPVDGAGIISALMAARDHAHEQFRALPSESYGCLFVDARGEVAEPASADLAAFTPLAPSRLGVWPSFPETRSNRD